MWTFTHFTRRSLHHHFCVRTIFFVVLMGVVALAADHTLNAQNPTGLRFFQARDRDALRPLTPNQHGELGDPFFNLVLKSRADVTSLSEIEALLNQAAPGQPGKKPSIFVVDENIADPARTHRRSVMSFDGVVAGQQLKGNVMLSFSFDESGYPERPRDIEAWGWDEARGRYNYYKLDNTGSAQNQKVWRFRGSSAGADKLSATAREGTCMSCHVTGGPIMKELSFPWNNWHSFQAEAAYLKTSDPKAWAVANDPRFKNSLAGAEQLEQMLVGSFNRFNQKRMRESVTRDVGGNFVLTAGMAKVTEGRRLLRPLFETVEVNIGSAPVISGLHPVSGAQTGPTSPVKIPSTFFLNAVLFHGNGALGVEGLRLPTDGAFERATTLSSVEYRALIENSSVELGRQHGDANFAWLTPEAGQVDVMMVDRLLKEGVVSPAFVASISAVDLESPILSASRARLLRFVPNTFLFKPRVPGSSLTAHPDELSRMVIAALDAVSPLPNSPEAELLANLRSSDPVARLMTKITASQSQMTLRLNDPATRPAELARFQQILIGRRRAVNSHPIFKHLNETGDRLFPLPAE